jgi:subtilisin-like proprotein convertase family protein
VSLQPTNMTTKIMKTIPFKSALKSLGLCASVLAAGSALASPPTFNVSQNYNIGLAIPDNDPTGLAVTESFSALGISSISQLTVSLDITGGANGDFYAYLQHGSGVSVLLNRVGRDSGNSIGYANPGMNVTFDDTAVNGDIHTYQLTLNPGASQLTGTWAPDGRTIDPSLSLTSSPRTAPLSDFNGLDPNGNWTLFIADLDPGGIGTLQSFSLDVTGVPEPGTCWLLALGGISLVVARVFAMRLNKTTSAKP